MSQPHPASPARPPALVTGGSSGIGRELARQFALHGFDLVISGSSDRVEEAAEALRLNGATVVPAKSDLATYDGVEAVWTAVQETGRPLAAAAPNAGIGIGGAFIDTALEDELRMIAINATATSATETSARVVGLCGVTPNNNDSSKRENAIDAPIPATTPMPTSNTPRVMINLNTSLRCAPSATRIPISRVRRATENVSTP